MHVRVGSRAKFMAGFGYRLRGILSLFLKTLSTQSIVQIVGFLCGLLIVRLLSVQEYALYTIANAMLGVLAVLGDSGISAGAMSQGGRCWQDKKALGVVISTAMRLRKSFSWLAFLLILPALLYLLVHNGAGWVASILIVLTMVPAFVSGLTASLMAIPFKLHQDISKLQSIGLQVNIGRLLLLTSALFFLPASAVAILCGGISQVWGNWRLARVYRMYAEDNSQQSLKVKKNLIVTVRKTAPGALYYSLSGQISVWLISVLGSSQNVAEIGALGRIAAVSAIFASVFTMVATPRYARMSVKNSKLVSHYVLVVLSLFLLFFAFLAGAYIFDDVILSILGEPYHGLSNELILMLAGSGLASAGGVVYGMNAARGYIIPPLMYYPAVICFQVCLVLILPVNTLVGVLMLSLGVNGLVCFSQMIYGLYRAREERVS